MIEVQSLLRNHILVPFDSEGELVADRMGADLRLVGKGIEIRDLFDASLCLSMGLPILTNNRVHYAGIEGLKLLPR